MKAIILGIAVLAAGPAWSAEINLVCDGQGVRTTIRHGFDDNVALSSAQFQNQIEVRISGDQGRIRIPPAMLPPEHSGGQDGWWDLRDLVQTTAEISAKVRFNFMNKPTIRINRITGNISIDAGRGQFSGQCQRISSDTKPKF